MASFSGRSLVARLVVALQLARLAAATTSTSYQWVRPDQLLLRLDFERPSIASDADGLVTGAADLSGFGNDVVNFGAQYKACAASACALGRQRCPSTDLPSSAHPRLARLPRSVGLPAHAPCTSPPTRGPSSTCVQATGGQEGQTDGAFFFDGSSRLEVREHGGGARGARRAGAEGRGGGCVYGG